MPKIKKKGKGCHKATINETNKTYYKQRCNNSNRRKVSSKPKRSLQVKVARPDPSQ